MITQVKEITQKIIQAACDGQNIHDNPTIVLGLSGGPDSVFLLHLLASLQVKIVAAHLDHEWRVESGEDVEFCMQLCQNLGVDFVTSKAEALNFNFNGSKEDLGRRMRRFFFEQVLARNNGNFIALAHHAQDQQETFFMRLIRGTTLSGLGCMASIDGKYIRPLLDVNKEDIINYLEQNQIEYLTDSTNLSDDYLRNRIRKHAIPALKKCDARFEFKFKSTLQQIKLEDAFFKKLAQQEFERIFTFDSAQNGWTGDLTKFCNVDPVLQRRVVLFWLVKENIKFNLSSKYLDEILRFLNSGRGGKHQLSDDWYLLKKKNLFKIEVH